VTWFLWSVVLVGGTALIVWGAERFAENLSKAAARLGVGAFALALLLAGAEPEELATVVAASLRDAPGIAFGDIIGANVAICLVALPVGRWLPGLYPSAAGSWSTPWRRCRSAPSPSPWSGTAS
jgi:cation:H+ antiporter